MDLLQTGFVSHAEAAASRKKRCSRFSDSLPQKNAPRLCVTAVDDVAVNQREDKLADEGCGAQGAVDAAIFCPLCTRFLEGDRGNNHGLPRSPESKNGPVSTEVAVSAPPRFRLPSSVHPCPHPYYFFLRRCLAPVRAEGRKPLHSLLQPWPAPNVVAVCSNRQIAKKDPIRFNAAKVPGCPRSSHSRLVPGATTKAGNCRFWFPRRTFSSAGQSGIFRPIPGRSCRKQCLASCLEFFWKIACSVRLLDRRRHPGSVRCSSAHTAKGPRGAFGQSFVRLAKLLRLFFSLPDRFPVIPVRVKST